MVDNKTVSSSDTMAFCRSDNIFNFRPGGDQGLAGASPDMGEYKKFLLFHSGVAYV